MTALLSQSPVGPEGQPSRLAQPLRRGDVVEVRSLPEIQATLDAEGRLDGLPFMEEMTRYCGRRFRVLMRADRVCVETTSEKHRLRDTVSLDELRCAGQAHGGCQRGCVLLWKEAWLKRAPGQALDGERLEEEATAYPLCADATAQCNGRFVCQSTALRDAVVPFERWELAKYIADLTNGNLSVREMAQRIVRILRLRIATRLGRTIRGSAARTPTATLGLQPGEIVEVRSRAEIVETLDRYGRNRGLEIEPAMFYRCGRRYRVLGRVERIILEKNGEMRTINDTVTLEGVNCDRCARQARIYWREIWLQRVDGGADKQEIARST